MSAFLTIRQAAERLGVSADTLRQWERSGRLLAERTEGGHRRYRIEQVEQLLARRSNRGSAPEARRPPSAPAASLAPATAYPAQRGPRVPSSPQLEPYLDGRVKDARARVELRRLRREALEQEAEIERQRGRVEQERKVARRRELHQNQLCDLKAFGRSLAPSFIAPAGRAEITRDLEEFVTGEHFPPDLPRGEAELLVQDRVNGLLARIEQKRVEAAAKDERERRRAINQMQLDRLISAGVRAARRDTWSWQTIDELRALRDVEEQLREEVRAGWTFAQVEALVTDVLSEFEECGAEDPALGLEDDEEGDADEED